MGSIPIARSRNSGISVALALRGKELRSLGFRSGHPRGGPRHGRESQGDDPDQADEDIEFECQLIAPEAIE